MHAADDPVSCRNSLAYQAACLEHRVPVACHLFTKGGHGFGLRAKGTVRVWPDLLVDWLRDSMAVAGKISPEDLDLIQITDSVEEVVRIIQGETGATVEPTDIEALGAEDQW